MHHGSESALHSAAGGSASSYSAMMVPYNKDQAAYASPQAAATSVLARHASGSASAEAEPEPEDHLSALYSKMEAESPGYFKEIAHRLWTTIHIQYLKVMEYNTFSPTLAKFKLECERGRITSAIMDAIKETHEHRETLRGLKETYDLFEAKFVDIVRAHRESHDLTNQATGRRDPFTQPVLMEMLSVNEDDLYNQLKMWKVTIRSTRRKYNNANRMLSDCHRDFEQNTLAIEQLTNVRLVDKIVSKLQEARQVDTSEITDQLVNRLEEYNESMRERHTNSEINNRLFQQAMDGVEGTREDLGERDKLAREYDGGMDYAPGAGDAAFSGGGSSMRRIEDDGLMASIFVKLDISPGQAPAPAPSTPMKAAASAPMAYAMPPPPPPPPLASFARPYHQPQLHQPQQAAVPPSKARSRMALDAMFNVT